MDKIAFDRSVYSLQSFLEVAVQHWGNQLKAHHLSCMGEEAQVPQKRAWFDCFNILRREIALIYLPGNLLDKIYIVFEYELPRERGRRPDVLLLSGQYLLILEFKGYSEENQAQIDQAKHYARDLRSYHSSSHALQVLPMLVLAKGNQVKTETDGVIIVSGDQLHDVLEPYLKEAFPKVQEWFEGEYAPLPSLLQSAQLLFKENKFPQIKRALSAGIPETLAKLEEIAKVSQETQTHHLALITGVPGAGKTLVGLQFVFDTYIQNQKQLAVFLSGNGPLVDVLQKSLGSLNFVQSVHGFLKQYAHGTQIPYEQVIIFDEAQRAWDSEKVYSSPSRGSTNAEPTDFINIANKKAHCLLIGLIGEGQEIYLGEESGMQLWQEAIQQSAKQWVIHCPDKLQPVFPGLEVNLIKEFNLTTSLRTHQALTLQKWVEALLSNQIGLAHDLASKLQEEDYPIYITSNLDKAKAHLQEKYIEEPNKTYGLIASSKSKILPKYGVPNDYNSTKVLSASNYYVEENHPSYCRNLVTVVTEFACQGLELDMPILGWDADFIYEQGWVNKAPMAKAKDARKLRLNTYRVLLTRGRDGLIIYVPNDALLHNTYAVLLEAGCKPL